MLPHDGPVEHVPFLDLLRLHVDTLNCRFAAMSADLDRVNSTISDLIGDPPETLGLRADNIQNNEHHTQ